MRASGGEAEMSDSKHDDDAIARATACSCGYAKKVERLKELLLQRDAAFWSRRNWETYLLGVAYMHNNEGCQAFHKWVDEVIAMLEREEKKRLWWLTHKLRANSR